MLGQLPSTLTKRNKDEKVISDSYEQRHSHDTTLKPRPRAKLRPQHYLEDNRPFFQIVAQYSRDLVITNNQQKKRCEIKNSCLTF